MEVVYGLIMLNQYLQRRLFKYSELSTTLSYLDDSKLTDLFESPLATSKGWGINHVLSIGEHELFVKRIPLSDRVYHYPYSTRNWHLLPTFYNYPVGSAGINSFRELAAHIKTTNWVLSGQCVHFPLLYHHRILPRQPNDAPIDADGLNKYLAQWKNDEQIRKYILERRAAKQEVVLFLEYFPHELGDWFQHNVAATESILKQTKEVLRFMYSQRFIHFDLTFDNMLTDGDQVYLADFGMSLDWDFDLCANERAFFEQNTLFDFGIFLKSLAFYVITQFVKLPEQLKEKISVEFNLSGKDPLTSRDKSRLIKEIESLAASGSLPIEQNFVDTVLEYHDIILLMQEFIGDMLENDEKDTIYDPEHLRILLQKSGLLLA